jgi:hypothetical protein
MTWKDKATPDELAELDRLQLARDAGAAAYNSYYSKLMRRCQSRIRQAKLKADGGKTT